MPREFTQQEPVKKTPEADVKTSGTSVYTEANPFSGLQRTLGNQAMARLLESGGLQTKLRISQPDDADEQEADRVADQIVSAKHALTIQRKCACGGSCSKCAHNRKDEEDVIHRSIVSSPLRSSPLSLQRATADSAAPSASANATPPSTSGPAAGKQHSAALIVEDDAPSITPTQMRKSQFVALLQTTACATADAALASVGHTTKGCPYIKKWLDHYKNQDAQHLTRAMYKYAPETRQAHTAYAAIALVNQRVHQAAVSWAKTGKVTGMPEELQAELTGGGGGFLGAIAGFASSGFGSAVLGFLGGGKKSETGESGKIQKKTQHEASSDSGAHDATTVRSQLGSGHSLDSRVQSQMSSAFGYDFSRVRVHTDSHAAGLSADLQARAFTIGSDVAFAAGEYQPGTLIGDALIAHELAHVVQQGGGKHNAGPQSKDAFLNNDNGLEQDADRSAVGAMVSVWTGAKTGLADVGANALPRLKSGLKLQKCSCHKNQTPVKAPSTPIPAPAPPPKPVDPEKSFFFEDPALQPAETEGSNVDFSQRPTGPQTGITSSSQQRRQVVVDKPEDYSKIGGSIPVVVRFAYPASEFSGRSLSSGAKTAKKAVLDAVAQIFSDLGTFQYADAADERRILQERARLTEALKGFTKTNPLNIYLAAETEEETMSGEFFPVTARVFVNMKDVGDPDKLKAAIRFPLHNILGGPNPAKGATGDPAASSTDVKKSVLHESLHVLLLNQSADSDSEWKKVQTQLAITGPDPVKQQAMDLVHSYLLAQEELFAYNNVELLYPPQPGEKQEAKAAYELYRKSVELFFTRHGIKIKQDKVKLSVSEKAKGRPVQWEIIYSFPTQMTLKDSDADVLTFILKQWPLSVSRPHKR